MLLSKADVILGTPWAIFSLSSEEDILCLTLTEVSLQAPCLSL